MQYTNTKLAATHDGGDPLPDVNGQNLVPVEGSRQRKRPRCKESRSTALKGFVGVGLRADPQRIHPPGTSTENRSTTTVIANSFFIGRLLSRL